MYSFTDDSRYLNDFSYKDADIKEKLYSELKATDFQGVVDRIIFDENQDKSAALHFKRMQSKFLVFIKFK